MTDFCKTINKLILSLLSILRYVWRYPKFTKKELLF
jgi:hypothetical protein